MELNINTTTNSGRIELTADQREKLFSAMQKLAEEKRALILANHSPEYWENYRNAFQRRRLGVVSPTENRS
ncbi:hypothetical protein SAMN04487996_112219 [Dyadobacter soli]|uniref:Uncharacterized protein n=1 Tax=Dyadobacter soli TaxID=659014 RepID=A0A1G7NZZ8_9BACT|nr:hypothetical protein [Dyadobacter soli]SDF79622.1 hypothetical protein SAMN04487996_112219 [Dyadobacter soli]